MKTNDQIVNTIVYLKNEQNLSLSELARRVGMAKSALSRYFNKNREFPLNRLGTFADALNTTPEEILGIPKQNELNTIIQQLDIKNREEIQKYAEFRLKEQKINSKQK